MQQFTRKKVARDELEFVVDKKWIKYNYKYTLSKLSLRYKYTKNPLSLKMQVQPPKGSVFLITINLPIEYKW